MPTILPIYLGNAAKTDRCIPARIDPDTFLFGEAVGTTLTQNNLQPEMVDAGHNFRRRGIVVKLNLEAFHPAFANHQYLLANQLLTARIGIVLMNEEYPKPSPRHSPRTCGKAAVWKRP